MKPIDYIALISLVIAVLAWLASRKSAQEAKKANDIGRMNALLALQMHYKDRIKHQEAICASMKGQVSFQQAARDEVEVLEEKSKEVDAAIKKMHEKVV